MSVGALPPHPRKGRERPLTPPRERYAFGAAR